MSHMRLKLFDFLKYTFSNVPTITYVSLMCDNIPYKFDIGILKAVPMG